MDQDYLDICLWVGWKNKERFGWKQVCWKNPPKTDQNARTNTRSDWDNLLKNMYSDRL